jgi:dihydroceramidase
MIANLVEKHGYWSPRTASVDWCEPNYLHSYYVAEWFNTLSSFAVVLMGLTGVILSLIYSYKKRFFFSFLAMFIVGCGSVAFHGTLLFQGQALDELPMVWGTQIFLFIAIESAYDGFDTLRFKWLPFALTIYCIIFTAGYFYLGTDAFVFFVALYISGVVTLVGMSISLYARTSLVAQRLGLFSNIIYAGGFLLLWLPDKFLCSFFQPYSFHAWFHLTSTIGPWMGINFLLFAHYALAREHAEKKQGDRTKNISAPRAELLFLPIIPLPYVALDFTQHKKENKSSLQ